ncbi:MAG: DEAD/DEAH box helicase [Cenarchaeum sp. SB0661_bin_35]|nr:DEAD/DEAH box helicase [Cenarchaeum sp. SB0661_bin_35]
MKFEELKTGIMIEGTKWDGQVTLEQFENKGEYIKLTIRRDDGSKSIVREKLEDIHIHHTEYGTPWRTRAAVDMLRHKHAKGSGEEYGEMDPLPHQIQSIYHITSQYDDIRFLLADEPGAGKTAVASSIIRELQLQGRANRTLIVTPAHLKYQWKEELKRFVGLKSYIIEGGTVDQADPWPDDRDILVTSIDYAKGDTKLATLKHTDFDLVVVDEAHHMNSSGKNVSKRYRVGEALSDISTHMLFLTATPHRGKPENFQRLLKLLRPDLFPDGLTPEEVAVRKESMFLRHLKTEMVDMEGNPIFKSRTIKSLKYEMSKPEQDMYRMVSNYVRIQHQKLVEMGERLAPFVLLLIQKRMASSTHSLQKTLERRRGRLQDALDSGVLLHNTSEYRELSDRGLDDEDEDEDDPEHERRDDVLSGITASHTPEQLEEEIAELDELIELADQAATTKPDKKLEKLRDIMDNLGEDKLLIFSEFKDTINYLEDNIGEKTCRIDGDMKQEQRDRAVQEFRDTYRIMLATDAAREGMNMQFCNVMVNYDLPWSPIVLEQRMGRLHRYGQEKDVTIHNMIADNTIEGDVLERLSEKIMEIQKQYKAVDVIGTILSEVNMKDIMVESIKGGAATGMDGVSKIMGGFEQVQKMMKHTPVDLEAALRKKEEIKVKHVDGEYLKRMMYTIFEGLGRRIKSTDKKTTLQVPDELRGMQFRRKHESFNMPVDQLLSRGTKKYKHIEDWVLDNCRVDLQGGSVFAGRHTGHIVFHTTELNDRVGKTAEVLVHAHHITTDGIIESVHPDILGELEDVGGDAGDKPAVNVGDAAYEDAQMRVDRLNEEEKEFWRRRGETTDIDSVLERLRDDMSEVMNGTTEWNKMDEKRKRLEERQDDMERRATTDKLHVEEPVLMGWVKVIPNKDTQDTDTRGMNRSMEIERMEGWIPEDVSNKRGSGRDITSRHPDGRERHIEVKSRCAFTEIDFTENEEKARLNDPDYMVDVHIIEGEKHDTFRIYEPAKLKTKKKVSYGVSISEIKCLGVVYEYSEEL